MVKNVILLSSFVPVNNYSPVSVNLKMVRLCCETFINTELITANFPKEAVKQFSADRFTLTNVNVDFSSYSVLGNLLRYIKMQVEMICLLRRRAKKDTSVFFWLSGPLILPFLYCKVTGFYTAGFLYGNSRKKADRLTLFNWLKAVLIEAIAKGSNMMCLESPGVAEHWGLKYDPKKMEIVHLYVDTDKFYPVGNSRDRPYVIGMCCRLVHSKRVLESIQAFHKLRTKYPEYQMEIAGDGLLADSCAQLIKQLGEGDRIKLLGWVGNDKLPEYLRRWRLMLAPTNYEGIPNSLLEAMACGTPVLSSPVGGVPDVMRQEVEGWLLPDNSCETIAIWLQKLLCDQESLAAASQKSRERILEKYSFEPTLRNFNYFAQRINTNGEK